MENVMMDESEEARWMQSEAPPADKDEARRAREHFIRLWRSRLADGWDKVNARASSGPTWWLRELHAAGL